MKRRALRVVRSMLVVLLCCLALPGLGNAATLGGQLYGTGGDITVTILYASAGYTSELYLYSPVYTYIGTNREVGKVVTIQGVAAGAELVFGIHVLNTGNTFKMGPGSRNGDGLAHANVTANGPGDFTVGFEDLFGGGDRDYDDNMFRFQGALAAQPKPDTVPPTTTHTVTPAPGPSGWIADGAAVSLHATDSAPPEAVVSGVDRIYASVDGTPQACMPGDDCAFSIGTSGMHTVAYYAKDKAGNSEAGHTLQVNVDADGPSIVGAPDRAPNMAGWYDADVTVSFTCADASSGIASCSGPTVLGEGAAQSVTGTAMDNVGHTASATVGGINIDKTAPSIGYSGNAGSYGVDQMVSIACTAADGLSGLAANSCANISGPAYTFPLGTNSFSASATDLAGNTAGATATFTVSASADGICALVNQWVSQHGVANSLCMKLRNAEKAKTDQAKSGLIDAFAHELEAQADKTVSREHADMLIMLAQAL